VYHLAASLYRRLGRVEGYVRTRGFDNLQQTQMILTALQANGQIARREAASLCQITERQATYLLSKMARQGQLELVGKGRSAHYVPKHTN